MKQSSRKPIHLRAELQLGLSLIELMISITIGLLILVSLSTLFINQSKSRAELDKSNRMIDNGRYALELLSNNLRLAGYYDNYAPPGTPTPGVPTTLYDPCDTVAITDPTKNLDILRLPVQGYNAATATSTIASLPCGSAYIPGGLTYTAGSNLSLKAGSDILVVRRASTAIAGSAVSGTTYLQVSMCQTDTATPPNNYQIVAAPTPLSAAFNSAVSSMHKRLCSASGPLAGDGLADLREFRVLTYFISPSNNPTVVIPGSGCTVGDCIPTLKQIDPYGTVTPLVEGIEYMQLDYGVDDTGDGSTDRYVDCSACSLTDWSNIVAVRINIVARNTQQTTGWSDSKTYALGIAGTVVPFNDAYKRHAYTQLIRLVNPSGRRE
jgi:type IV pilus assembly protein PilW